MCVTSARSVKPKVPADPLIEWAARKMAFSCSVSGLADVEPEQQGLHVGQMLVGLFEEDLVELAHVDGHVRLRCTIRRPLNR